LTTKGRKPLLFPRFFVKSFEESPPTDPERGKVPLSKESRRNPGERLRNETTFGMG